MAKTRCARTICAVVTGAAGVLAVHLYNEIRSSAAEAAAARTQS